MKNIENFRECLRWILVSNSPHSPEWRTRVLALFSQDSFLSRQWLAYVFPSVEHTGSWVVGHLAGHWQCVLPSPKDTHMAPHRQKVFSHGSETIKKIKLENRFIQRNSTNVFYALFIASNRNSNETIVRNSRIIRLYVPVPRPRANSTVYVYLCAT